MEYQHSSKTIHDEILIGLAGEEKITLAFLTIGQRKIRLYDIDKQVKNVRFRLLLEWGLGALHKAWKG